MSGGEEEVSKNPPAERADCAAKLRDVPHKPGVYLMRDRFARVIYVGKALDLRRRLASYFTTGGAARAEMKTKALIESIWDFEWHVVRSEPEALLFESRLIKEFRPRYNVLLRDDKRFLLVRVHMGEAFPRVTLTRLRKDDGARYFGPYPYGVALRTALQALKKRLGLRSCRPASPCERDFRHCHDHIIKNCSAPCVGKITSEEYRARVAQLCEFLDGGAKYLTEAVEEEMHAAARAMEFEKAANLRDLLADLRTTAEPVKRFTRHSLPTTIEPERDIEKLREALLLERAPAVMECFDISNITSTHIVAAMVRFTNGKPDRAEYRHYRIRGVEGQDDFASMAEVIRRRYSRVLSEGRAVAGEDASFTQELPIDAMRRLDARADAGRGRPMVRLPDLVVVDGGRGQLSSACRELQRLGLGGLPIIGLAKEFEEIYRPGLPSPLRLPEDSGALRLLQRLRDEAHRFANGYHSLLLKKRMSESVLDEISGMGEGRKTALLRAFGSVAALRRAELEKVAAVRGIGREFAERILAHLARP